VKRTLRSALASLLREERDGYVLGLVRLLLGLLIALYARQQLVQIGSSDYFADVFHMPLIFEGGVPSRPVYQGLLVLELGGALLAVVGFYGREGLLAATSIGIYLLACDRLQYHNNRFALLVAGFLCAFMPSDRSFLLYRGRRHALSPEARRGPTFARRLLQVQVSTFYFASGTGKLLDPDWWGGHPTHVRMLRNLAATAAQGVHVPDWYAELLRSPLTASLASKGAISFELALSIALWLPRTRALALWAGALFHVGIQIQLHVEFFSWMMGPCYVAFVRPELHERRAIVDPTRPLGRWVRGALPWLDWLARFRIEEQSADTSGSTLLVIDRDGRHCKGVAALGALARGLPALYLAWPLLALIGRLKARSARPLRLA